MPRRKKSRKTCIELHIQDLKKLIRITCDLRGKWYDIGVQLGLKVSTLDCIKRDCHTTPECFREMLCHWLKSVDPIPTVQSLIEVLEQPVINEQQVANNLRAEYGILRLKGSYKSANRIKGHTNVNRKWVLCAYVVVTLFACGVVVTLFGIIDMHIPAAINMPNPKTLPRRIPGVFMGRDEELGKLRSLIDFQNTTAIISITGPPGCGKSSLAIHAGNRAKNLGVSIFYADLDEVSSMQTMQDELLHSVKREENRECDGIWEWAEALHKDTLFIFDNCDSILHYFKDDFQKFIKELVKKSEHLKVMMTAQRVTKFTSFYEAVPIAELASIDATNVLMTIADISNDEAMQISKFVGQVPLALQVVGTLMKEQSAAVVLKELKRNLLTTLSPDDLPREERVLTTLNISYQYLKPEFQLCGQILASFNGSFLDTTAREIFAALQQLEWFMLPEGWKMLDDEECLHVLRQRSLLSVNWHTGRYKFHGLIQDFFQFVQSQEVIHSPRNSQIQKYFTLFFTKYAVETAHWQHFGKRFINFLSGAEREQLPEHMIDQYVALYEDRHHYRFDYKILNRLIPLNLQHPILDIESSLIFKKSNLTKLDAKLMVALNGSMFLRYMKNFYRILAHFETFEQKQYMDLFGEVEYFTKYIELSMNLNLVETVLLKPKLTLKNLKLRNDNVLDLYHRASVHNRQAAKRSLVKYYSAIAHKCLIQDHFDEFIDYWQKILKLRMDKCTYRRCTNLQLGLKAFGEGQYQLMIEYLKPLLWSKGMSFHRNGRILVMLHHAYISIGDKTSAKRLLLNDTLLNSARLCDHIHIPMGERNSSIRMQCLTRDELEIVLSDQSHFWVIANCPQCHVHIQPLHVVDETNYRTTVILGKFYKYIGEELVGMDLITAAQLHIETRHTLKLGYSPSLMLWLLLQRNQWKSMYYVT